jgi:hypothetical protein
MRRHLLTLALFGAFGAFVMVSDAQACHKRKCTPACAPAPCAVVEPCPPPPCPPPAPVCEPVCAPKKHCFSFKMPKLCMPKLNLCHKRTACAPVCEPACGGAAPVAYSAPVASPQGYGAPVYAAPQVHASGQ